MDFIIQLNFTRDNFWETNRTLYNVSMLPPEHKAKLKAEMMAFFDSIASPAGELSVPHPMRRITVRKVSGL
jgi:hypothetical protein